MPFKIRVDQRLSNFTNKRYFGGLGWMTKIMNRNKEGGFEDIRCVPSIYSDFFMSVEEYEGYLEVEYVYTRKYFI